MSFYDDTFSIAKKPSQAHGGSVKNGTMRSSGRLKGLVKDAPTLPPPDLMLDCDRPYYRRPMHRNQRAQTLPKWIVAACVIITAITSYQLGLHHWSHASKQPFPNEHSSTASAPAAPLAMQPAPLPPPEPRLEADLARIPGGSYFMGDTTGELKDARPHQVTLAPFMMARHEVTLKLWDSVMLWGRDHGYPDLPAGSGKTHNHPVSGICWGDAVKWCNAFSEKNGLVPCYYTEPTRQNVARKGTVDLSNQHVSWQATGYRLPTEAEWEFAARGGLKNKRFPWGDEITHEQANYHGSPLIHYDKSQREGISPSWMGTPPYTAAVGSFQPNRFGLYDMAGNVAEWCWDFYDPDYETAEPKSINPQGPNHGKACVVRGGSWRHTAAEARCANRFSLPGDLPTAYVGFRVVRSL